MLPAHFAPTDSQESVRRTHVAHTGKPPGIDVGVTGAAGRDSAPRGLLELLTKLDLEFKR